MAHAAEEESIYPKSMRLVLALLLAAEPALATQRARPGGPSSSVQGTPGALPETILVTPGPGGAFTLDSAPLTLPPELAAQPVVVAAAGALPPALAASVVAAPGVLLQAPVPPTSEGDPSTEEASPTARMGETVEAAAEATEGLAADRPDPAAAAAVFFDAATGARFELTTTGISEILPDGSRRLLPAGPAEPREAREPPPPRGARRALGALWRGLGRAVDFLAPPRLLMALAGAAVAAAPWVVGAPEFAPFHGFNAFTALLVAFGVHTMLFAWLNMGPLPKEPEPPLFFQTDTSRPPPAPAPRPRLLTRRFFLRAALAGGIVGAGWAYPRGFFDPRRWDRYAELRGRIAAARPRGRDFLLGSQRSGSWGTDASVRSYDNTHTRVPVTAIVVEALDGFGDEVSRAGAAAGARYVEANLGLGPDDLRRRGEIVPGVNVQLYAWAFALSMLLRRPHTPGTRAQAESLIARIAADSWRYSSDSANPGTFQIALLALALQDAQRLGFALPTLPNGGETILGRILNLLASSRLPDGSFPYRTHETGNQADAAARSALAELALFRAGRSDPARLLDAAERFARWRTGLEAVLRMDHASSAALRGGSPHYGPHQWAKYYYLFGMRWTARALAETDPSERGRTLAAELAEALLGLQKEDGSWVDSPQYAGPHYGTASALLALRDLEEVLAR